MMTRSSGLSARENCAGRKLSLSMPGLEPPGAYLWPITVNSEQQAKPIAAQSRSSHRFFYHTDGACSSTPDQSRGRGKPENLSSPYHPGLPCTRAGNDECSVLACPSVATPVTSRLASTSAIYGFPMLSPKLVDTGNAGRDHVRCFCQQLILIGCVVGNLDVAIEQE